MNKLIRRTFEKCFLFFEENRNWYFLKWQFAWIVKFYFMGKKHENFFKLWFAKCIIQHARRAANMSLSASAKAAINWYESTAAKGKHVNITKTRIFKYIEKFNSKKWKFSDKKTLIFFYISAQNIDCEHLLEPPQWGGSNEYPQSMYLSINNKNNVNPCKPKLYYIKMGFKGVKIIYACFRDEWNGWIAIENNKNEAYIQFRSKYCLM